MADLDDFFAKRDKKKKKAGKFEADNIAKILEKKRQEADKTLQQDVVDSVPEQKQVAEEDDEWREAVEEKPDLSGLRIQELVLEDEEEHENDEGIEEDVNKEGPWKLKQKEEVQNQIEIGTIPSTNNTGKEIDQDSKSSVGGDDDDIGSETSSKDESQPPPTGVSEKKAYVPPGRRNVAPVAPPAKQVTPSEPKAPPPATASGAYVPPSRRGEQSSIGDSMGVPKRPKKALPNINDTELFPSLGS